ncbi:hypothetical protein Ancab_015729 [Ancistrocladus abbreviatus]
MERKVCSSAGELLKRRVFSGRELSSSETSFPISSWSSHSLFSGDAESKAILGNSGTSGYAETIQSMNAGQTVAKPNHLNCDDDDISRISRAKRTNSKGNFPSSVAEQITMTCSSPSVNSSYPAGFQKHINSQATEVISDKGQSMVKEGESYSQKMYNCSGEALQSPEDISDRSDPSETSSYINDPASDISLKGQPVQCLMEQVDSPVVRQVNCGIDGKKCDSPTAADSVKLEAKMNDEKQSVAGALGCFKQKEQIKLSSALDLLNKQEIPLQSQAANDTDGSDELVDVRVCDICGDVGREALLAICSRCNDGAEHIYCMHIKMDKVPEGDWMCEECMMVEEEQWKLQAGVDISAEASKPSSLDGRASVSGKLNSDVEDSDNSILKHTCSTSHLPVKRPGPSLQVSRKVKRRALEKDVQSRGLPGSITKGVRQQSPSESMYKGPHHARMTSFQGSFSNNVVVKACSPLVDKSLKAKLQSAGGPLHASKSMGGSDLKLKVQTRGDGFQLQRKITEGTISHDMKGSISRKLTKSISFSGAGTVHSDVSGSKTKMGEDSNAPQDCLENKNFQRSCSFNINSKEPNSPKIGSDTSKLENRRFSVPRERNLKLLQRRNSHQIKTIELHGRLKVSKPLGRFADKCSSYANGSVKNPEAGSGEQRRFSCHGGSGISFFETGSSCHGLKPNGEAKLEHMPRDANALLRTTDKVLPDISSSMKDLPAFPPVGVIPFSAVPEDDCIWKGIFKLEKGGKLPSYSDGVQAHLSSTASPNVLDVALKFPHEILLTETSRLDAWPMHFEKSGVTEDNIALYFFAEDLQSYVRSYKRLLDCMVMNDLVLKADFNGVELLIFPSVVLPERSQRWNNLLFLWGVFRVRKVSSPDHLSASSPQIPSLNVGTTGQKEEISAPIGGGLSPSPAFQKSIQAASTGHIDQSCEPEMSLEQKTGLLPDKVDMSLANPVENEQLNGNMQHSNDSQKDDGCKNRYSERKHASSNLLEHAVDADVCCKTGSSLLNGYESHSHPGTNFSDRMSFLGVDDPSLKFSLKEGRHPIMGMAGSSRTSSISLDSGPSAPSDSGEWSKDEGQMELLDGAPSLQLRLGNATKLTVQGETVLSHGFTGEGNDKPRHPAEDEAEEDLSVSLSLALPGSSKGFMLDNVPKPQRPAPKRDDLDLSLLLFGGIRKV